jgi:hypothetical protein
MPHNGSCLCRAIRFTITGELRPIMYCHCEQCRRTSGHHVAATACARDKIDIEDDGQLRWYQSSDDAKRGFCARCGSSLFWLPEQYAHISVMAGSLDTPTNIEGGRHIFVRDKSDYYVVDDGLPQDKERGQISIMGEPTLSDASTII